MKNVPYLFAMSVIFGEICCNASGMQSIMHHELGQQENPGLTSTKVTGLTQTKASNAELINQFTDVVAAVTAAMQGNEAVIVDLSSENAKLRAQAADWPDKGKRIQRTVIRKNGRD